MSGGRSCRTSRRGTENIKREAGACSLRWRDCTSSPRGLGAEFSGTFRRSLRTTFSGHPSNQPCPHLPARGGGYPVYLFAPGYLVDPVGAPAFDRLNPDPNHIPDLDLGRVTLLRGSVLPSVDLVQDVRQHEVPLAPPARSGSYAPQHGLLDGADGALCKVGVAPGHLLLDVPEIHQLLEPS